MNNNGAYFNPPDVITVILTKQDEKALEPAYNWAINIDDTTLSIAVKDIFYMHNECQWPDNSIIHNIVNWLMTFEPYNRMDRSTVLDIVQNGIMDEAARRFANNILYD